ncbi:unnamed protein product [Moneuplotes crassus]|uniref:BZIP domain-containing protein n=1 Tax=Euplotes crassus TaxID=5936 RepID=A0AAD1XAQ7_EUPCR|nr:unnamed protein product [Moneuplotes crassus]
MLNRKSAVKARVRKNTKLESLTGKIQVLELKVKDLETENFGLKNKNLELERRMKELLEETEAMKKEKQVRKRFKSGEDGVGVGLVCGNNSSTNNPLTSSRCFSDSSLMQEELSEFLSSEGDEFGELKVKSWLNQSDVVDNVLESSQAKRIKSSKEDMKDESSPAISKLNF